jgi:voltage-gated potassium channel
MMQGRIRQIVGRRRLDQKIGRMKNRGIIDGYGRIGRILTRNLTHHILDLITIGSKTMPAMWAAMRIEKISISERMLKSPRGLSLF